MAWTSADVTAVETAINARISGGAVQSYSIGGRSLSYMSLAELRELRREMLIELNASTTTRTKGSIRYA